MLPLRESLNDPDFQKLCSELAASPNQHEADNHYLDDIPLDFSNDDFCLFGECSPFGGIVDDKNFGDGIDIFDAKSLGNTFCCLESSAGEGNINEKLVISFATPGIALPPCNSWDDDASSLLFDDESAMSDMGNKKRQRENDDLDAFSSGYVLSHPRKQPRIVSITTADAPASSSVPLQPANIGNQQQQQQQQQQRQQQQQQQGPRFRQYQEDNWNSMYEELMEFERENGHCLVPACDKALSQWVKRQRRQYKLTLKNKSSAMTEERMSKLSSIGFVWDSHALAWEERLQELLEFKKNFGHCNVSSSYKDYPQLSVWVKRQRRQYKLYFSGQTSTIDMDRINKLTEIGFVWQLRKSKGINSVNSADEDNHM